MNDSDTRAIAALQVEVRHISENTRRIAESLEKTLDKHAQRIDEAFVLIQGLQKREAERAAAQGAALNVGKFAWAIFAGVGAGAWALLQVALHKLGYI